MKLNVARAIVATSAFVAVLSCAHQNNPGKTMHNSQKIDGLVGHLMATELSALNVVSAFGTKVSELDGVTNITVGSVPFESVSMSRFGEDYNLSFHLMPGHWKLSDVTDDTNAWRRAPLLPDTGQQEVYRDWDFRHMTISCIARVALDSSNESYTVQSLRCQISPP